MSQQLPLEPAKAPVMSLSAVPQLNLQLEGDKVRDLHRALNRALNCDPEAPKWLFELCDMLENA